MSISGNKYGYKTGVCTSSTRPANPYVGQVIYETDSTLTLVYNGSSWDPIVASTGFKNFIINGDFRINQRGLTSVSGTGYLFDRWASFNTNGTITYTTQSFTLGSEATTGYIAPTYARVVTSGHSAAGDQTILFQGIEDVRTLAGATITVSFWARAASLTPKVAVEMVQNFGTGGSTAVNTLIGTVTLSTTWTRYSVTATLPSISGKTIASTDHRLQLNLWTSGGSTYNSRTGSIGSQNATIEFWGVQVERGNIATSFEQLPLGQSLALCQRYFYKLTRTSGFGHWAAPGVVLSATVAGRLNWYLPAVPRRAVTSSDISSSALIAYDGSVTNAITSFGAVYHEDGSNIIGFDINSSGMTAARPCIGLLSNAGSPYISFNAEY